MKAVNIACLVILMGLSGCASKPPAVDYSRFTAAEPQSILVLPPINRSPEVAAPFSMMAQLMAPIAESGYYVFPVAMVHETFQNNGLTVADDIHALPSERLREVFGADAALYVVIEEYGTSYMVLSSETIVSVTAKLVDLRDNSLLWEGSAAASSGSGGSGSGIIGALLEAAIKQIVETAMDSGFEVSGNASFSLLYAETHNGFLYGPRSPKFGQPVPSQQVE